MDFKKRVSLKNGTLFFYKKSYYFIFMHFWLLTIQTLYLHERIENYSFKKT